jgi:hypothetical protein
MTYTVTQLRQDLTRIDAKGKLSVLAAVSGISKGRLRQLMIGEGGAPTFMELTTIQMLKGA